MTEEQTNSPEPTPAADGDRDEFTALIARVQTAAENGEPVAHVRMQLVQDGVEPHTADAIVERVYNREDAPLSTRHRVPVRGDGANGWFVWIGILLFVNLLSWLFDWSFWIW